VCPPVVDPPCELAFGAGGKYALFPVPLIFPCEYVTDFYKAFVPAPPPGVTWTTIFRRDPDKEIELQALLDIAKGVKIHGKNFEIFLRVDGELRRPYRLPEYCGTREIAEKWAKACFAGREWVVLPVPA
jgi:hypothetical protein